MRPPRFWLITGAACAGVAATLALGAWQMDRAAQKLALHAAMEQRHALPPLEGSQLAAPGELAALLHRAVVVRGSWLPQHTVFLDNRQMLGKPGFYVVTPLQLEGSGVAVLVQRGWVQRDFTNREHLPAVETPAGVVELQGRIAPPPSKLYEFNGAQEGTIRQNLDMAQFRAQTRLALPELSVQQMGAPSGGLLREWPEPATGVEKHYGYAFQWWALSALIAILYVWFQFIAPRRQARHA